MKTTNHITLADFRHAFNAYGRNDCFTYAGQEALFDYLEELEDSTGTPIELDIVSLCCKFAEYDAIEDVMNEYPSIENLDDLREKTSVIEFDGGLIVKEF